MGQGTARAVVMSGRGSHGYVHRLPVAGGTTATEITTTPAAKTAASTAAATEITAAASPAAAQSTA